MFNNNIIFSKMHTIFAMLFAEPGEVNRNASDTGNRGLDISPADGRRDTSNFSFTAAQSSES